jgi:hypothetical protein
MNRIQTILVLLGCLTISVAAQADRATLSGTATDSSGAAMAGVHVELTDTATGFHRDAITGEAGFYSIGTLAAGAYKATFSADRSRLSRNQGRTTSIAACTNIFVTTSSIPGRPSIPRFFPRCG